MALRTPPLQPLSRLSLYTCQLESLIRGCLSLQTVHTTKAGPNLSGCCCAPNTQKLLKERMDAMLQLLPMARPPLPGFQGATVPSEHHVSHPTKENQFLRGLCFHHSWLICSCAFWGVLRVTIGLFEKDGVLGFRAGLVLHFNVPRRGM